MQALASRSFATASLILLAATSSACTSGRSHEPFSLVAMDEVERMLSEPGVVVIDANTPETFQKNHLPGARYYKSAPLAELLPADKATRLVFYCASPG